MAFLPESPSGRRGSAPCAYCLAKASMGDGYPQMVLTVVTMFVGLFLIVLFAHDGIMGLAQRLRERLARRAAP